MNPPCVLSATAAGRGTESRSTIANDNGLVRTRKPSQCDRQLKPAFSYFIFTSLACIYLLPFMRIMLPLSNEGTLIYGAERIVHGEVFARDFFEVMGPGTFYIVALFFKIIGISFLATRVWLFCSSLGIACCIYFLARRVCPRYPLLPCLVMAGTSFGSQWPSISHHVDSNLFVFLAVVCLVLWKERRISSLIYAAGVCAGITAWIHQPKGALVLIAILLWMVVTPVPGVNRIRASGCILAGFSVIALAGCVYFISHGAFRSLWYANVVWPSHNYGAVNRVPYALGIFSEYWRHWAVIHGTASAWSIILASVLIVPFLAVALVPLLLPVSLFSLRIRAVEPVVLLCILSGGAIWLSEIHRMDMYHLAFGSPLLLLVCLRALSNLDYRVVQWAIQLLAISAVCLVTINLLQVVTAPTASSRVGNIGVLRPEPLLQFVDTHIPAGQEVLFYPYCPIYYFLTAAKNPTRFSILVYDYNTPGEFDEVVRNLEARRVRYVIWDHAFEERTFKAVFPGVPPVSAQDRIIEPYLNKRYTQIARMDDYSILMRNE